jgi:hypothetical protein
VKRRRRLDPAVPVTSPDFKWIGSASHDAGSDDFRARQKARMERVQAEAAATSTKVSSIKAKARVA